MTKQEFDSISDVEFASKFSIALGKGYESLGRRGDMAIIASSNTIKRLTAVGWAQEVQGVNDVINKAMLILVHTMDPVSEPGKTNLALRIKRDESIPDGEFRLQAPWRARALEDES